MPNYQIIANQLFQISNCDDLKKAYDSLTGEGTTATQQATFDMRSQFFDAVLNDTDSLANCSREPYEATRVECKKLERVWASASRLNVWQDGNSNSASSFAGAYNLTGGYEKLVQPYLMLGLAAGIGSSNFDVADRWTSGSVTGANFAAYGAVTSDVGLYLKGAVSVGAFVNDYTRYALGNMVAASHDTTALGGKSEVGMRRQLGFLGITPFVAAQIDELSQPAYNEDNTVYGNRFETMRQMSRLTSSGIQLDSLFEVAGYQISPMAKVSWSHEASLQRSLIASSLAAPGYYWRVDGISPAANLTRYDLGLRGRLDNAVELGAKASFVRSSTRNSNSGELSLTVRF